MMMSIHWVIVCDLVSLIGGIVLGVSLMRPRHYHALYDRRYD